MEKKQTPDLFKGNDKLQLVCNVAIVGFVVSVFFHYILGLYLKKPWPFNTFLFVPDWYQTDLYDILRPISVGDPMGPTTSVYFPATYLYLLPLALLKGNAPFIVYLILFVGSLIFSFWNEISFSRKRDGILPFFYLSALTFPFLFCVDRANIEALLLVLFVIFFALFKKKKNIAASLFLAIATSMKGYPLIFAALFIARKQWRPAILAGVLALLFTIAGVFLLPYGPKETLHHMALNLAHFKTMCIIEDAGLLTNLSYFNAIKIMIRIFKVPVAMNTFYRVYMVVATLLGGGCFFAVAFWVKGLWRQLIILLCAALLFPPVSFDYKLIYFLPICYYFIGHKTEGPAERSIVWVLSLLLIPKSYAWLLSNVSIASVIDPLLLTVLLILVLRDAFKTTKSMKTEISIV